jgi:ubiquinone/menaquinone biosynthesis C-methylase UbiE
VPTDDAVAKKTSSTRHFDRWARDYESDPISRHLATLQQQALAALELGPGDRMLDVGCGTGAAVRIAAATGESAVGIDLSPAMIARGRELAAALSNVELLEADAEALPFADHAFTAVLCTTSLHHYPHPDRALGEMSRVLAPGGRIAVADIVRDRLVMRAVDPVLRRVQHGHVGCKRTTELAALMSDAGLIEPRVRPLMRGFYAIVIARKPAQPAA